MLSSKWSLPKASVSQDWTHETHSAAVNMPIALGSCFRFEKKDGAVIPRIRLPCFGFAGRLLLWAIGIRLPIPERFFDLFKVYR